MKMPSMQFYPADWRKDPGVQALSFFDRGVWFEMLCLMHESAERGVLLLNGKPMPEEALARVLGLDNQVVNQILTTLLTYGVASRRVLDGALYCRRMVRDEELCQVRREAGKKGGNPNLVNQNSNQKTTTGVNQNPTPSISSSPSSSSSNINTTTADEKKNNSGGFENLEKPESEKIGAAVLEVQELEEPALLNTEKASHTWGAPPGNLPEAVPHLFRDSPLYDRDKFTQAFQRHGFEEQGIDPDFYYDALKTWSEFGSKSSPREQKSHAWSKELASFIRRDKNAGKLAMLKPPEAEAAKPKSQFQTRSELAHAVVNSFEYDDNGNRL